MQSLGGPAFVQLSKSGTGPGLLSSKINSCPVFVDSDSLPLLFFFFSLFPASSGSPFFFFFLFSLSLTLCLMSSSLHHHLLTSSKSYIIITLILLPLSTYTTITSSHTTYTTYTSSTYLIPSMTFNLLYLRLILKVCLLIYDIDFNLSSYINIIKSYQWSTTTTTTTTQTSWWFIITNHRW